MLKSDAIDFINKKIKEISTEKPPAPHVILKWLRVIQNYLKHLFGEDSDFYQVAKSHQMPNPSKQDYYSNVNIIVTSVCWVLEDALVLIDSGVLDNKFENNTIKQSSASVAKNGLFIDLIRIEELKKAAHKDYNTKRLIKICEEINTCYINECYMATIVLTRALLDHVPPLFGKTNFGEIASNYGAKSFKEAMQHLENSSRKIADLYLHHHIDKSETLPNATQVNFSQGLDLLLAEVINNLRINIPPVKKQKELVSKNEKKEIIEPVKPTIEDSIQEKANRINQIEEFQQKRERTLKSQETIQKARNEVDNIIKIIESKVNELNSNKSNTLFYHKRIGVNPKCYILESKEHSFSVYWNEKIRFDERTGKCLQNDSLLIVKYFFGILIDHNKNVLQNTKTTSNQYAFDLQTNGDLSWKLHETDLFFSNDNVAKKCIDWILDAMLIRKQQAL